MNDDDDLLAGVDLKAWQVPPPVAAHRPNILVRALAPAAAPRKRRIGWMIAGAVALNAAVVAILVVLLRPPAPAPVVLSAGPTVDARVQELLAKLQAERAELERRLAEIKEMQGLIEELSKKVKSYEERDRNKTLPKDPKESKEAKLPTPVEQPVTGCDEVSCVLSNYEGACCQAYRKADVPPPPTPKELDRAAISAGIASVRAEVRACGADVTERETVKLRVNVAPSGLVSSVTVEARTDATLAACVKRSVNGAVFPTTVKGGRFVYPFEFVPSN